MPSQAAIARALGVSASLVTKLKKTGMPVTSIEAAQAWRKVNVNAYTGEREPEKVNEGKSALVNGTKLAATADDVAGAPSYSEARARREHAEAERAEMEVAQMAGRLIERFAAEAGVFQAFRMLRDRVLTVPMRCAPTVSGMDNVREIELLLADALAKALDVEGQFVATTCAKLSPQPPQKGTR